MSHATLKKAEEIIEAAEREPLKYGDLLKEMDSKQRGLSGIHRKLKVRQQIEMLEQQPPALPSGKYSVIVADPPWRFDIRNDDTSKRNLLPYASMSMEEIKALPIADLAHEHAILFLFCPNAHLHDAFHVLEAWGFQYKTIITWVKTANGTENGSVQETG